MTKDENLIQELKECIGAKKLLLHLYNPILWGMSDLPWKEKDLSEKEFDKMSLEEKRNIVYQRLTANSAKILSERIEQKEEELKRKRILQEEELANREKQLLEAWNKLEEYKRNMTEGLVKQLAKN